MPVKKDQNGQRSVEVEVEVPGSPEEVWQAIATGPGITSWFVPSRIEEDDGVPRRLVCNFGPGMDSVATITAWDPPRRLVAENAWAPNMPNVATEWIVEARAGGMCVVRVVHRLFASTDDWDNQLESTETGWPSFFRILRIYLTHFRSLRCSPIQVIGFARDALDKAWADLRDAFALDGVRAGQRWRAPLEGVPTLAGIVESVEEGKHPHVLLRVDEPAPGVAHLGAFDCGAVQVMISLYLYGDKAASVAAREEPVWRAWMNDRFPMNADAGGEA
jgi:uncharacterized protein YndB with AHSA1/START domain